MIQQERYRMNVLFYGNPGNGVTKKILKAINEVVLKKHIENYHTLKSFSIRLRQFSKEPTIAVLYATNRRELSKILAIQNLLFGIHIILILPDTKNETITNGHKLHPRFLSYVDSDFKDVTAVLKKMIGSAPEIK
jgi:hypothetical protein